MQAKARVISIAWHYVTFKSENYKGGGVEFIGDSTPLHYVSSLVLSACLPPPGVGWSVSQMWRFHVPYVKRASPCAEWSCNCQFSLMYKASLPFNASSSNSSCILLIFPLVREVPWLALFHKLGRETILSSHQNHYIRTIFLSSSSFHKPPPI